MFSTFVNQLPRNEALQSMSLAFMKEQKEYLSNSTRRVIYPSRPSLNEISQVPSEVFSTPYTHYFRGGTSETPHIFNRRAGWTPQYAFVSPYFPSDVPRHCFQQSCNYIPTYHEKDGECCPEKCINLYR